ncbi:MAG TPA: hypothetical protein VEB42_09930 [Chitinophagaceae bacterium]|nr:hypothetical protein [Chitinophagaceae bacterium]
MEKENKPGIVPEHHTGKPIDTESSVVLDTQEDAKRFFETVKNRLQNVNRWHEIAGELSAQFQLVDSSGQEVNRTVQKGDYFRIDVPGPGSKSGEGYDWVRVEEIEDSSGQDSETFGIRVRPAEDPQNNKNDVAHFYSPESSSSFTVRRADTRVTAGVYDRNTKPNDEPDSVIDKIRDAVVGFLGVLSFSKIQWKALVKGLVKRDD